MNNPDKVYMGLYVSRNIFCTFKTECDRLGMKYNRQVEIMMQKFIEEHENK